MHLWRTCLQRISLRHSIPDFLNAITLPCHQPLLHFWFTTTSLMWWKRNQKIIIYYLTWKKYSLLALSKNGKAILTSWMIVGDNFFCYLSLLHLNLMLKRSSVNCFTVYSIQIKIIQNRFQNRRCTFCEAKPETLHHTCILYQCPYSWQFWNDFESYWCLLSNQQVHLWLQNVIFGIISKQCPSTKLLNYFVVVGKLFLWDCWRNQIKSRIKG